SEHPLAQCGRMGGGSAVHLGQRLILQRQVPQPVVPERESFGREEVRDLGIGSLHLSGGPVQYFQSYGFRGHQRHRGERELRTSHGGTAWPAQYHHGTPRRVLIGFCSTGILAKTFLPVWFWFVSSLRPHRQECLC